MVRLLLIALCCLPLCLAPTTGVSQDKAKADDKQEPAAPAPRTYTQEEVDAAGEVVSALTPERRALINHLRFLLRPGFELELMKGLAFRPCALAPLEIPGAGAPNALELARLWAVLASGMEASEPVLQLLDRFLAVKTPKITDSLGDCGLRMALCATALRRPELGRVEMLQQRAKEALTAAMKARITTEGESPLLVGEYIEPKWFANHLWRALICRFALELQLEFNERVWESSIRALCSTGSKTRGWNSKRGGDSQQLEDLDTNLFAIAALSLARTAPEKTLGNELLRSVEKDFKPVPAVLLRLETEYSAPLSGTRLAMVRSLDESISPEGRQRDAWQKVVLEFALENADFTGAVMDFRGVPDALGITAEGLSRDARQVVGTAMSCIALSGGLLPGGTGPLTGLSIGEIGRAMHALSVLHACRLPAEGGLETSPEVEDAIRRGCEYLEGIQEGDGHFAGQFDAVFGNTAVAMLAMMHGGYDRDSEPIQRAMNWLCSKDGNKVGVEPWANGGNCTYGDALVLLMFQKYYEREQQESGILWADTPAEFEAARLATWNAMSKRHQEVIETLVKRLNDAYVSDGAGYWGYGTGGPHRDNSNTQFAILGYKAASLLGAGISTTRLEHEARRLIKAYKIEKKAATVSLKIEEQGATSSTFWRGSIQIGGWGYNEDYPAAMGMTAAGVSSLAICRDELKVRGKMNRDLARSIALTIHGAQHWLAHNYYERDDENYFKKPIADWADLYSGYDGIGLYYDLYSIERACVLAGLKTIGFDVDWYKIGADGLVATQHENGEWTLAAPKGQKSTDGIQTINTAWAILFLKKGAPPIIAEPKLRQPRPVVPPSPTTPDPKPPEPKDPVTGK